MSFSYWNSLLKGWRFWVINFLITKLIPCLWHLAVFYWSLIVASCPFCLCRLQTPSELRGDYFLRREYDQINCECVCMCVSSDCSSGHPSRPLPFPLVGRMLEQAPSRGESQHIMGVWEGPWGEECRSSGAPHMEPAECTTFRISESLITMCNWNMSHRDIGAVWIP